MKLLVTDALWERLEAVAAGSAPTPFPLFPGRKRLDYRKILTGFLFVLKEPGINLGGSPGQNWAAVAARPAGSISKRWHEAGVWTDFTPCCSRNSRQV